MALEKEGGKKKRDGLGQRDECCWRAKNKRIVGGVGWMDELAPFNLG